MLQRKELTAFLDGLLSVKDYSADPSNNGLQCEGNEKVRKVLFGVDACAALFEVAAETGADYVVVHHGLSWGGGFKRLTGIEAGRYRLLLTNGISLYAAHLPLDAHPEHGNNAILADMLDLRKREKFFAYHGYDIGICGRLKERTGIENMAEIFADRLDTDYTILGDGTRLARQVGIVSGGGGSEAVVEAAELGFDCLITGEITHADYHVAEECGIPVLTLGHYKSETVGVRRLAELVGSRFGIACEFVDLPTGL